MRFALAAALALFVAPIASIAETKHYSDTEYLRASRCAALSDVPALKAEAGDMSWLAKALKEQRRGREDFILIKAGDQTRDIARVGRNANTEAKIAALRTEHISACQGFAGPQTDSAGTPDKPQG
jgi:hypothetical protein